MVVLYTRNVLHYNLNYVELYQYCLLLLSKKVIFQKKVTMQVITATVTNVFISASKYKKIHDKSIKKFLKMKFWIREFPKIRDDVIDDDVSIKMANMFI